MYLTAFTRILDFLCSNIMTLLQKDGEHLSGHEVFLKRMEVAFTNLAESTEHACRAK